MAVREQVDLPDPFLSFDGVDASFCHEGGGFSDWLGVLNFVIIIIFLMRWKRLPQVRGAWGFGGGGWTPPPFGFGGSRGVRTGGGGGDVGGWEGAVNSAARGVCLDCHIAGAGGSTSTRHDRLHPGRFRCVRARHSFFPPQTRRRRHHLGSASGISSVYPRTTRPCACACTPSLLLVGGEGVCR